jgi:hypothetical protein
MTTAVQKALWHDARLQRRTTAKDEVRIAFYFSTMPRTRKHATDAEIVTILLSDLLA